MRISDWSSDVCSSDLRVEVVILSRNDPVSGLRVFKSAKDAGINVQRGVFPRGAPPFRYLKPLGAHLFLSANDAEVNAALDPQFPAARVLSQSFVDATRIPNALRNSFDGDAVMFSEQTEPQFQGSGLDSFQRPDTPPPHR